MSHLPQKSYSFDSFPRSLLHAGRKCQTATTSTSPIRRWAMPVTLLLLFRIVSTMLSSRWYKGPNCNNLHVTHMRVCHAGHITRRYEGPDCKLISLTYSTSYAHVLRPHFHSHNYCCDYFPRCLLHGSTNGLTTQHSRALRPLAHTLISLLPQQNSCFDSFPRCLLHGGTKGLTSTTSASPIRMWAMPLTLLLLLGGTKDLTTNLSHTLIPLLTPTHLDHSCTHTTTASTTFHTAFFTEVRKA
jgi:hypothetical protein